MPFTPPASTKLWLKPDGLSAGSLATWPDASGLANDATMTAATVVASVINGLPVVRFNASTTIGTLANVISFADCTAFIVQRTAGFFAILTNDGTSTQIGIGLSGANQLYFYVGSPTSSSDLTTPRTSPCLLELTRAGSALSFYENGFAKGTGTQAGSGTLHKIGVASLDDGDIAEILFCDTALSDADRESVESYLNTKYGFTGPGSGIAGAAITRGAFTATGVTLTANVTGGTAPFTYQWQESTSPDAGFASISSASGPVSGGTSQTAVIGGRSDGQVRHVQCVVTDAAVTSATSFYYVVGSVYPSSPTLPYGCVPATIPLRVILIGDSTWTTGMNFDQATLLAILSNQWLPTSPATVSNHAISGTTSQGWLASSSTGDLNGLIAAESGGVCDFCIGLGVNDARASGANAGEVNHLSASAYAANLASIAATLLGTSKFAGSRVWLFGPGYVAAPTAIGGFDDTSIALLLQYCQAIPGVANGTTIRVGDATNRYYTFAQNQALLTDGVHETVAGGTILAEIVARGVIAGLLGPAGGAGPTSFAF